MELDPSPQTPPVLGASEVFPEAEAAVMTDFESSQVFFSAVHSVSDDERSRRTSGIVARLALGSFKPA